MLLGGAWYWLSGAPMSGEPAYEWGPSVLVVWRVGLFVTAFALAYLAGAVGW